MTGRTSKLATTRPLSVKEAAIQILREAGRPLHLEELTHRMLTSGLWRTSGKTPVQTVAAQLYTDVKKFGERSPFVHTGPRIFALRHDWEAEALPETKVSVEYDVETSRTQDERPSLSFTEAAVRVLEEYGSRQPMHYRDITRRAIELGWIATSSKNPAATMYSQLISEIKRYEKRGETPRFVQLGRGMFGLTSWLPTELIRTIERHNEEVRRRLLAHLMKLDPGSFEELIAQLLAEMGFEEIEVTSRSADGGIDVRGTLVVGDVIRTRMAVQVKRWRRTVQRPVVQQVRGSLGTHEQGLIITTSSFTRSAQEEAQRRDAKPVALMDGEQLVRLLAKYELGIKRQRHHHPIELDLEALRELLGDSARDPS